jgi:hypothetical protein
LHANRPAIAKPYLPALKKSPKNYTRTLRLDAAVLIAAISTTIFVSADEYRVWQDKEGHKIEAAFKGVEGDQVKLGLASGEVLPLAISKLSDADREWLKTSSVQQAPAEFHLPEEMDIILDGSCFTCHEEGTEKGNIRLDNLDELSLDARLDLMNKIQEQVFLEHMPPKKKSQPTEEERRDLVAWLSKELNAHNASKLEEKLRMPAYGNYVDHEKLFSGKYKDLKASTPDRRWLISEFIFDAKFNKLLGHTPFLTVDGTRHFVIGSNNRSVTVTNPFLLPTDSGVRYYDTTTLDGGHLLTMITNAKNVADSMISLAERNNNVPTIRAIMAKEWEHRKILAARRIYLTASIESLLGELYSSGNAAMLPVFSPTKFEAPEQAVGPDGKPLKKPVFDTAAPARNEVEEIWAGIRRHSKAGVSEETVIVQCEKDWFIFGVNDRTLESRVKFMHGYMEDLIKRMPNNQPKAPNPPAEAELEIIRTAIKKHRQKGDTYSAIIDKCMTAWDEDFSQERANAGPPSDELTGDLVDQLFAQILERAPSAKEKEGYFAQTKSDIGKIGSEKAIGKLIQTLVLNSDFVYRNEFGQGQADEFGRKMLSPYDASYAISYALTDSSPDKELAAAAASGKLNTREDYKREVERMLAKRDQYYLIDEAVDKGGADSFTNMPIRELRFFRDFFGYPRMLPIFKDNKRFGGDYVGATGRLVSEADMLVEHILEEDKNVFEQLLTTEDFYVYHSGDNEAMTTSTQNISKIYEYFKDKGWEKFDEKELMKHLPFLKQVPVRNINADELANNKGADRAVGALKQSMESYVKRLSKGQTSAAPFPAYPSHGVTEAMSRTGKQLRGEAMVKCFNLDLVNWNYPAVQPAKIDHRKGILTHPAWLIAFAANTETDPVRRGKWVREKLLAGTVPDVPVTVDAVIPEDHTKTLRSRLKRKTEATYCWGCHESMNPLGNTFEMYDDFGRFRTDEALEHPENLIKKMPDKGPPQDDLRDIYKTLPVDATGHLAGTGDKSLDGDLKDAIDLAERLGKSTRVRQSIIRHAFRYFMGRNEFLSDSQTLIDADQAYLKSGGSFDAVIVSLLTSDSFIYHKANSN